MPDALADHYALLARYNRWLNERLYDACEQLSDAERKADRGAFFGSIHRTLEHLVYGDKLWLGRFALQGEGFAALPPDLVRLPPGAGYGSVMHDDWAALRAERARLDAAIEDWVREMPAAFAASTMRYANTAGVPRAHPAWAALAHFFNHQTHHRGQVTTLLSQAGIDPGATDMIVLA